MNQFLLIIPSCLLLLHCGPLETEAPAAESPSSPKKESHPIIGEVTSVHAKQGFLLFKKNRRSIIDLEGTFSVRSLNGRRAIAITPTGEQLGRFYAADYQTSDEQPKVGDMVVYIQLSTPPAPVQSQTPSTTPVIME